MEDSRKRENLHVAEEFEMRAARPIVINNKYDDTETEDEDERTNLGDTKAAKTIASQDSDRNGKRIREWATVQPSKVQIPRSGSNDQSEELFNRQPSELQHFKRKTLINSPKPTNLVSSLSDPELSSVNSSKKVKQVASDREVALGIAAMDAVDKEVDPTSDKEVAESQFVAGGIGNQAPVSTLAKDSTESSATTSKTKVKVDQSTGPGSKQAWLQSEKVVVLELLTEQSKKYRRPKYARLANAYNHRMYGQNIEQAANELLLNSGKNKFLGRDRTAPWRSKVALMKVAKTWPETRPILESSLRMYSLTTGIETDPLAGIPDADDPIDDEEHKQPPVAAAQAAYNPKVKKSTKRTHDEDDEEEIEKVVMKKPKTRAGLALSRKRLPRDDGDDETARDEQDDAAIGA